MERRGLTEACQWQRARHPVLDVPSTQRETALPGSPTGEEGVGSRRLPPRPLPQGFGDIRGERHPPIHLPFPGINTDRALGNGERGPRAAPPGARVSEFVYLQVPEVYVDEQMLLITHAKGGKQRYVPLLPELTHELRTYLRDRTTGPLFTTSDLLNFD